MKHIEQLDHKPQISVALNFQRLYFMYSVSSLPIEKPRRGEQGHVWWLEQPDVWSSRIVSIRLALLVHY